MDKRKAFSPVVAARNDAADKLASDLAELRTPAARPDYSLTDAEIAELRRWANGADYSYPTWLVAERGDKPVARRILATIDALRLTLERLQEPTDKVTDAFYQAWIQHGDKKSAMAQLRIAIKAAAKAAAE